MARSLFALVALFLACAVFGVPAPLPFMWGWSNPVDPDRDCKIRRDNGVLIIEMPGGDHDYDTVHERVNAPRILRDFEGDFNMEVRVRIDCRPSIASTVKDKRSFVAAGFLIIPPDTFSELFMRYQYGVAGVGTGADGFASQLCRADQGGSMNGICDKYWKNWPFKAKPEHVCMRLERQGEGLLCQFSPDRKSWVTIGGATYMGLPTKLKVGLAAFSTSTDRSKVRFDQLSLTRGKKKKR